MLRDSELANTYDRHAPAIYAYCGSLLADDEAAAEALTSTFVVAACRSTVLRDPDRFRPWLFALARYECQRLLHTNPKLADPTAAGPPDGATPDGGDDVPGLVRRALAGLAPDEREIIELSVRHRLYGAELVDVLGIGADQAGALQSRARERLERALGADLLVRSGETSCAELRAVLAIQDDPMTALQRRRVDRHIGRCDACRRCQRRECDRALRQIWLAAPSPPPRVREDVLRLVSEVTPDATTDRVSALRSAPSFDPSGFPSPQAKWQLSELPTPAAQRRRVEVRAVYAAVAAVVLVSVIAGGAAYLRHLTAVGTADQSGALSLPAAGLPGPAPTTAEPTASGKSRPHSKTSPAMLTPAPELVMGSSPPPSPKASASTSPTPSPSPSPTPSPSPSRPPSPRPSPPRPGH
jgi:DNA-directed RNA polymerase specialized sigma24 family protein